MVRNFWIEGNIDGRKTEMSGGPRTKDGGFSLNIYQRDAGGIVKALRIEGGADDAGNLSLVVVPVEKDPYVENTGYLKITTQR